MRLLRLALSLLACVVATGAAAQYPDRPIRLIVPQAAGSATDTVARLLGAELGKELGQQTVVDNRPGGALTIGLDLTAKAEPDGYTICMGPIGALAITRHMVAKLPYDSSATCSRLRSQRAGTCCSRSRPRCRSNRWRSSSPTPRIIRASFLTPRPATDHRGTWAASCSST